MRLASTHLKMSQKGKAAHFEEVTKKLHPLYWDTYIDAIVLGLSNKLMIQRIYQEIHESAEITTSYSGLRDYIRKAFPKRKIGYLNISKRYEVLHSNH